jgi:hypothetical protein
MGAQPDTPTVAAAILCILIFIFLVLRQQNWKLEPPSCLQAGRRRRTRERSILAGPLALREQWRREKHRVVLPLWSDTHRRTPTGVLVYEPFDFTKEPARARREPVFGKESAAIVSYEPLLGLKKSAGRSQDLLDVEKLHKLNLHQKKP